MKHLLTFLIASIGLISCSSKQPQTPELAEITIPERHEKDSVFFNQFELQSMIVLDSSNKAIAGNIKRLIINDKHIYILSRHIHKFNLDGKFICQIGNPGKSGSEYRQIIDFTIDEKNGTIIVFSDDYKLIYYTLDGEYIKHERLDDKRLIDAMQIVNGDLYLYCKTKYKEHEKLIHRFINNKFVDYKELEVADFLDKSRGFNFGENFVKGKSILFSQNADNKIYELKDDTINVRYRITDYQFITEETKKEITKTDSNIGMVLFKNNAVVGYSSIRETDYGIFMKNNLSSIIWIEPNNTVHNFRYIKDDRISQASLRYVAHDANDNLVAFVADPMYIVKRKLQYPDPEIEARLQTITEDSNPVLLFYKHK